jgi:hypothetical protein
MGLILGEQEPLGIFLVFRPETFLFSRLAIVRVKHRAAPKHSIAILHFFSCSVWKLTGVRDDTVNVYLQRRLDYARIVAE